MMMVMCKWVFRKNCRLSHRHERTFKRTLHRTQTVYRANNASGCFSAACDKHAYPATERKKNTWRGDRRDRWEMSEKRANKCIPAFEQRLPELLHLRGAFIGFIETYAIAHMPRFHSLMHTFAMKFTKIHDFMSVIKMT